MSDKFVSPHKLHGDFIWIRRPLIKELRCLLTVNVTLEIEGIGIVETTAEVADSGMCYNLLCNETQKLIDESKKKKAKLVSAVITRSQVKRDPERNGKRGRSRQSVNSRRRDDRQAKKGGRREVIITANTK